jgi:broad specificity phosphatase PhoE
MVNLIYVMRHAQSTVNLVRQLSNELSGGLTQLGYEQANHAGKWLQDKQISAIFASPFERAQATAQIISDHLNIMFETEDGLREFDCGDLNGRSDEEAGLLFRSVFQGWIAGNPTAQFPGGEARQTGETRFAQVLQRAQTIQGNVLLVTHGGITRSILPYLCVNAAALQRIHTLQNTGFAVLEPYDTTRYICKAWGLAEHLNPASPNA